MRTRRGYVTFYTKFVLSGADVSGIRKHLGKVWQSERVSILTPFSGTSPPPTMVLAQQLEQHFLQRLIFTSHFSKVKLVDNEIFVLKICLMHGLRLVNTQEMVSRIDFDRK